MSKLSGTILTLPKMSGSVSTPKSLSGNVGAKTINIGSKGDDGATFIPSVSADGVISWTNDKELPNPEPVNIKGVKGDKGDKGDRGERGLQGERGEQGQKGDKGDRGEQGIQGVKGDSGENGISPHIGENGNWFIGDVDTGVSATGNNENTFFFTTDETLNLSEENVLSVNTAHEPNPDNTLPITAAAVAATVGNIEILLGTI